MKKLFKNYVIIWAILFAVFNIICFVAPSKVAGMSKFGGAFWAGYICITLAFLGQLVCAYVAFKADTLKKLFYNLPIITVSYTGLILTIVFGAICMAIPNLPNWAGSIVCLLVLALTAIAVVKAKTASDIVENTDKSIKTKTLFIKSLTAEAETLMSEARTPEIKAHAERVYEAVRYADPMSNAALVETEEQLEREFNAFADAVRKDDAELAESIASQLLTIVDRRNKKCKLLK